jgi:hypothetical protein
MAREDGIFEKTFLYSMYKKLFFTEFHGHSVCNKGQEEKWEKCFTYESCQMLQLCSVGDRLIQYERGAVAG